MIAPLFGYDFIDGKWVIVETEADLLRFLAAKSAGEYPDPPYHMVKSIMKYHNDKIPLRKAKKLAHEEHYINMYYRALCREKYIRATGHEPPKKDTMVGKMRPTTSSVESEPIIDKALFEAAQPIIEPKKIEYDEDGERWLDTEEIGEYLGVCRATVMTWIQTKALPAYKVGRGWRFKASEVDAWANSGGRKDISFQKLFAIMEERDISRKQLCEMTGLSPATITKLGKDGNVNSSVLDKICMALGCKIGDIVSFVPADKTDDA